MRGEGEKQSPSEKSRQKERKVQPHRRRWRKSEERADEEGKSKKSQNYLSFILLRRESGPGKLLMFGVREIARNRPQIVKFPESSGFRISAPPARGGRFTGLTNGSVGHVYGYETQIRNA